MSLTEHKIQSAFVEWCQWNEGRLPALKWGFAVPNGGARHPAVAAKLKAEGVRPGVPDWWLPVKKQSGLSSYQFTGLVIEFKSKQGRVSDAQREYIDFLRSEHWFVEVCYSTEEAINTVERYLK